MNNQSILPRFFLLTCLIVSGLCGCTAPVPKISYYSLVGPEIAPASAAQQGRVAVLIGPVSLPDVLKRSQIVTGRAEERYQLSENHRWAGELDHEVGRALGEWLARALGTEQIALYPMGSHLQPTHQVIVDVLVMDGMVGNDARLVVRWSLMDPGSDTVRATRRSAFSKKPVDNSYEAWVAAQRWNLRGLGQEIAMAMKATHP